MDGGSESREEHNGHPYDRKILQPVINRTKYAITKEHTNWIR